MKKSIKWVLVVVAIALLTSFVEKNRPARGLDVGDMAPDFALQPTTDDQPSDLSDLRGHYVLLSFWAGYDAPSRMQNIGLSRAATHLTSDSLTMVSVSFDDYASVFTETVAQDDIHADFCFVDTRGKASKLYNKYRIDRGFGNYLLDDHGVIVAKNITPDQLTAYID